MQTVLSTVASFLLLSSYAGAAKKEPSVFDLARPHLDKFYTARIAESTKASDSIKFKAAAPNVGSKK